MHDFYLFRILLLFIAQWYTRTLLARVRRFQTEKERLTKDDPVS